MKTPAPKATNRKRIPLKTSGGIGIANGDQVEDLGRKLNLIGPESPMEKTLPDSGDGGGSIGGPQPGGGGSAYTPGSGCAMLTRISSAPYSGNRRNEVFQVGPVVDVGFVYELMVYSHGVIVKAVAGDSPNSIAQKMAAAVNATTATQWNDQGSAPAAGTPGFKPTATYSGNTISAILNVQNSFAAWGTGCNNTSPPPPPPPIGLDAEEPPPPPVQNQAPIARAGDAITIQAPQNSVELDGSASTDPESGALTFNWAMLEGPGTPAITGGGTARPVISNLVPGHYTFRLTVFDAMGASSQSSVNITVLEATATPPPPIDTAPILTQYFGPFPTGGGGGAGANNGAAATPGKGKAADWLLYAFIAGSAAYILFAPNN